jgi:predicted small metal-binding protein
MQYTKDEFELKVDLSLHIRKAIAGIELPENDKERISNEISNELIQKIRRAKELNELIDSIK